MIPINTNIPEPAAKLRVAPAGTIRYRQDALIRVTKIIVFDSYIVHSLPGDQRTDPNGKEDVLEIAVGNSNVAARSPHAHAGWMHGGAQAPRFGAKIPRRACNIPRRSGETES